MSKCCLLKRKGSTSNCPSRRPLPTELVAHNAFACYIVMAIPPGLLGYVDFLSPQEQEGIREHLLGKPPERLFNGESSNELSLRAYFSYYTEQIARALDDKRVSASIKAHQDVFDIVDHLDTSMTRDEVQQKVRCPPSSICDVEIQKSTVDFVARLLLLVNFGDMHCVQLSRRRGLQWETNCLSGYLKAHFCQPIRLGEQRVSLGKSFTARNLHRIGGFGIILTNNLADHLRLTEDDKAVEIFHHASFLEHHRERFVPRIHLINEHESIRLTRTHAQIPLPRSISGRNPPHPFSSLPASRQRNGEMVSENPHVPESGSG